MIAHVRSRDGQSPMGTLNGMMMSFMIAAGSSAQVDRIDNTTCGVSFSGRADSNAMEVFREYCQGAELEIVFEQDE